MPEGKENRRHSKIPAGIAATSNRLETTKAVLNALKSVGTLEEVSFLQDASKTALAILAIIQGIDDGDIDDDFVALALDSLGLVYIVIDQCEEESKKNGTVFDGMKINSGELARTLQEVAVFVEKKAHRNLLKQIIKRSADEEKIDSYRQQLRTWMGKFGNFGDSSIHDVLQEVIDDKLRRLEQRDKKPKELIAESFLEASRPLTPLRYPPPVIVTPSSSPPPVPAKSPPKKPPKPLPPTNILSNGSRPPSRTGTPDLQLQPQRQHSSPSTSSLGTGEEKERQLMEAEERRRKRHEEERARKLAERERFRKSEQEFIQLPEAIPIDRTQPKATSSASRPPVITVQDGPGNAEAPSKRLPTHTRSKSQIEEDERLAAALHANIQQEFAKRDEEVAMNIALTEQRGWEVDKEKRSGRSSQKGNQGPRLRNSSRHRTPSLEVGYGDLDPEEVEDVRRQEGYRRSSEKYSQPDPRVGQSSRGRSSSNPVNDLIPSPYFTPQPSPYPVYASPPPPPPMNNIAYSAVALGGAPVYLTNQDSGNVRHVTIADSMNDYSVNRYSEDDSD